MANAECAVGAEYRADSALAVGATAATEGEWQHAVAEYQARYETPSAASLQLYNRELPEAAVILARRGLADSAIALFERAVSTSSKEVVGG